MLQLELPPRQATSRPRVRISWRWTAFFLFAGLFTLVAIEFFRVVAGNNFHTVVPGQVFRSAQPKAHHLQDAVAKHGIRSVINLRGPCPETPWYQAESQAAKSLGVTLHDIAFSSYHLPGVTELRELVAVLQRCEYPVLLHCRRGADRSGLASAVAMLLRTEASVDEARKQLSWRYAHLPIDEARSLVEVFNLYESWLAKHGRSHDGPTFADWATHHYLPSQCWAKIEPLDVPRELPYGRPVAARFRVHNRSDFPWQFKPGANSGVHLHYLLRSPDLKHAWMGSAGFFDEIVPPGGSIDLTLSLPAVRIPGKYLLRVDMSDEHCCWFFMVGSPPFDAEVEVLHEHKSAALR